MSNLTDHARNELTRAGLFDTDSDYGGGLGEAVMELIEVFASQGHSGMSAQMVSDIFNKVSRFEPILPLTGEDDEWGEMSHGSQQNKRCGRVFRDEDGSAYIIDGIVWREPNGCCFTNRDSYVPVAFPYTPKREYRDAPEAVTPDE